VLRQTLLVPPVEFKDGRTLTFTQITQQKEAKEARLCPLLPRILTLENICGRPRQYPSDEDFSEWKYNSAQFYSRQIAKALRA
jgi:hypothetical protein